MTTNHMGLEQSTLSDGELTVITDTDHVQCGDAAAMASELLAWRKTSKEPVAWESTTTCYVKYVTDKRYQGFSDQVKQWYKPYKCSSCAAPPL